MEKAIEVDIKRIRFNIRQEIARHEDAMAALNAELNKALNRCKHPSATYYHAPYDSGYCCDVCGKDVRRKGTKYV